MAGRGQSNGQNWQEKGSPYWNAKAEPEIDVWDPSSVSSGNYTESSQAAQQAPPPNMSNSNANPPNQNNGASNWGTTTTPVPQPPVYRHPNSTSMPPGHAQPPATNTQYYDQYQSGSPHQNDRGISSVYSRPYENNSYSNENIFYQSPRASQNTDWPPGSWRSQPNTNSYSGSNYSEPYIETPTAKKFSNPLMNSSDKSVDTAEDLVKQLHIQSQSDQKNANNAPRNPSVISKAALAMIKGDLQQAAVAFQSAENLELARNIHLGLVDVTENLGQNVVVSNLSAEAADFVPRSNLPKEHVPEQAPQEQEDALIENLQIFIENVLLQPGYFDELVALLIEQVSFYLHSDETVKEMVKIIFNKAINEDNFKYLGARLCDKLTMPKVLSNFRSIFLNHFQSEFKTIRGLIDEQKEEDTNKIHGFVMFMAEVFIHIKINGSPVIALGKSLCKTLQNLLLNPTTTNISFVCKTLKLAGGKLLDAFHVDKEDMENYQKTFTMLDKFSNEHKEKTSNESKSIVLLISSVSRLKDSNWGRTKSNTRPKSSIDDVEEYGEALAEVDQNYYMNEPVFFTPDGVQYTAAETQIPQFYEEHLAQHGIPNFLLSEDTESLSSSRWSEGGRAPWDKGNEAYDLLPSDDEDELNRQFSQESEYNREFEKFLEESGQL